VSEQNGPRLKHEDIIFIVESSPERYTFSYKTPDNRQQVLSTELTELLSTEIIGGFTSVYIGLYATGNGKKCSTPADFDWFEYKSIEK